MDVSLSKCPKRHVSALSSLVHSAFIPVWKFLICIVRNKGRLMELMVHPSGLSVFVDAFGTSVHFFSVTFPWLRARENRAALTCVCVDGMLAKSRMPVTGTCRGLLVPVTPFSWLVLSLHCTLVCWFVPYFASGLLAFCSFLLRLCMYLWQLWSVWRKAAECLAWTLQYVGQKMQNLKPASYFLVLTLGCQMYAPAFNWFHCTLWSQCQKFLIFFIVLVDWLAVSHIFMVHCVSIRCNTPKYAHWVCDVKRCIDTLHIYVVLQYDVSHQISPPGMRYEAASRHLAHVHCFTMQCIIDILSHWLSPPGVQYEITLL